MFWVAGRLQRHRRQSFMLSINRGNRLDSVEKVEAEKIYAAKDSRFLDFRKSKKRKWGRSSVG